MASILARLVLVFASVPALGDVNEARVLVLENPVTEQTYELEERLAREVERQMCLPLGGDDAAGETLVVNLQLGADGGLQVVNAHGGNDALRERVLRRLREVKLG